MDMSEYRTDPEHVLEPAAIRETLAGYAAASEIVETERQRMLARLTREEALAIWRDLMKGFNEHPERQRHLHRLDLWQAEGLVALRRALDRLAEARRKP
jgi:phytoene/squalene synthetase